MGLDVRIFWSLLHWFLIFFLLYGSAILFVRYLGNNVTDFILVEVPVWLLVFKKKFEEFTLFC